MGVTAVQEAPPVLSASLIEQDAIRRGATHSPLASIQAIETLTLTEETTDSIAMETFGGDKTPGWSPRLSQTRVSTAENASSLESEQFNDLLAEHAAAAAEETGLSQEVVKKGFGKFLNGDLSNSIGKVTSQDRVAALFGPKNAAGEPDLNENAIDEIFRLLLEAELTWMLDDLRYSTLLREESRVLKTQYLKFMAAVAAQYRKEANAIMKWGLFGSALQMASAAVPGIQTQSTINKILPRGFSTAHSGLINKITSKSAQEFTQKIMTEGGKSFSNMGTSDAKKHEATRTLEQAQAEVTRNFWDYARQQLQQERSAMTSKEEKVYQLLQQFIHLITQG